MHSYATVKNAVILPDADIQSLIESSDPDGNQLTLSFDPGAPASMAFADIAGDFQAATNTFVVWNPTRAFASTTNVITVRVTDDGVPPMSATQTFTVIVLDYMEISVGSTNMIAGQNVGVPIYLASSDGVTNLAFSIKWPTTYLSNATLVIAAPGTVSGTLQNQVTNLLISLHSTPGQVLQGQIAELRFSAISNETSAFVSLLPSGATASKPNGSAYGNYLNQPGTVAVVQNQSLLKATLTGGQHRELLLFGKPGTNYQVQYSTNLTQRNWSLLTGYTQTNEMVTMPVDSPNPAIFYRVFQP